MSIKAIIFDLDGTITEPFFDFDAIRVEIGMRPEDGTILEAMEHMDSQQRRRCREILRVHEQAAVNESSLNPGAAKTLHKLSKRGIKLGVLTRNTRENAMAVINKHNLKFDIVLGRDEAEVKPNADGVLKICRTFGIEPSQSMVVGDYLYDIQCAKAAGALAVLFATHKNADDFAPHADFTIERIDHILKIIDNLQLS